MIRSIKTLVASITALALMAFGTAANAAAYSCTGTVTLASVQVISGDAKVAVQLGTWNPHYVCSIDAQGSYTMSVNACKATLALLQAAKMTGATVDLYYNNAATCSTISYGGNQTDMYVISGPNY